MATRAALMTMEAVARSEQGAASSSEPGWSAAVGRWLRAMAPGSNALQEARRRAKDLFVADVLALLDGVNDAAQSAVHGLPSAVVDARFERAASNLMAIPTRFAGIEVAKQACALVLSRKPTAIGVDLPDLLSSLSDMDLCPEEKACVAMAREAMLVAAHEREAFTINDSAADAVADSLNVAIATDFYRERVGRARSLAQAGALDRATPQPTHGSIEAGPMRI